MRQWPQVTDHLGLGNKESQIQHNRIEHRWVGLLIDCRLPLLEPLKVDR
jgi:hypothetical protein